MPIDEPLGSAGSFAADDTRYGTQIIQRRGIVAPCVELLDTNSEAIENDQRLGEVVVWAQSAKE